MFINPVATAEAGTLQRERGDYLLYLSPSSPVGHKATTTLWLRPEPRLTRASYLVALPLLSFAMLSLVVLASFFRVAFYLRAILGILSLGILRTCPSLLSRELGDRG